MTLERLTGWDLPLAVFEANLEQFTTPRGRALHANTNLWRRLGLARRLGWTKRLRRTWAAGSKSAALSLLSRLTIRERLPFFPGRLPLASMLPRALQARLCETTRRAAMAVWLCRREEASAQVPVVLFRTDAHPDGSSADLGWSAFPSVMQIHRVEGDHRTMLFPPQAAAFADKLARLCLGAGAKAPAEAERL